MRKHEYKHVEKYNVDYRPLTHTEFTPNADFIKGDVYLYQREYLFILALLESKNIDTRQLFINCEECQERIEFQLKRNQIMVEDFDDKLYGNDGIALSVHPRNTGDEEIPDLIDYVMIDGEQIMWSDCSDKDKEMVLDAIDYATYKSISTALDKPAVVANIPVRCSCGHSHIVSLRGLQQFLKVV